MSNLKGKSVVLAVTGGIAAYKAVELARLLQKDGARVRVAMTQAATRFVTSLTFEALTREPVMCDLWDPLNAVDIPHISLADWADVVVVAPATANIIGKMASGLADDFVSTFLLAVKAPVLVCPAMNVNMFLNPVTQANLNKLRDFGILVMDPGEGALACGWEGPGRLPEPFMILEELRGAASGKDLAGLRITVTAGPTREPWDRIRFISNRSTGRMGVALAQAARRRGAEVVLVAGPMGSPPPYGLETVPVETTLEMREAVLGRLDRTDVLIKAAAPGDFRPARLVDGKVKKTKDPEPLELTRNPDILAEAGSRKGDTILVGFAAEWEDLIANATAKLKAKNLDLIVANQIGAPGVAFGAATNQVSLIDREGRVEPLPLLDKEDVADRILDQVAALVRERRARHAG